MSSSQALTKRSADSALMPPPPPPKRIKRPSKVIDEDSYTSGLSHIIARDFFPGLLELESQDEYLNAVKSQDADWIASAGQKLAQAMTPGPDGRRIRGRRGVSMTPTSSIHGATGETPRNWAGGGETPAGWTSASSRTDATSASTKKSSTAQPKVDTSLSLNAFQSKYVSEDSESFYKLLDKQNIKRNEKQAWLHAGNKIPEPRQIAYREQQAKLLAESQKQEAEDGQSSKSIVQEDTRPAGPETWKSNARNALMFEPQGIEDEMQTVAQAAEERSRAAPKAVSYDNTRLPTVSSSSTGAGAVPPSPSLSAVRDAIAGRPRRGSSTLASEAGGYEGGETPRVNGWTFVDSEEPEPEPEVEEENAERQVDYYDRFLGKAEKGKNPFTIQETCSREELLNRMVDRVVKGKRREKVERETRTPVQATPRFGFTPRVMGGAGGVGGKGGKGLTPAGHRLFGKLGGSTPGRTPVLGLSLGFRQKSGAENTWIKCSDGKMRRRTEL